MPLVIIAWLLASVPPEQYQQFKNRPKNWPLLLAAMVVVFCAVALTFVRWYLLVRALLRFRILDAFRLGFLGYLFNFVSVGSVGGDLFKAFFIAREQPGRRAEAVATVMVDRVVGYALVLLTSAVIWLVGFPIQTRTWQPFVILHWSPPPGVSASRSCWSRVSPAALGPRFSPVCRGSATCWDN